MTQHNGTYLGNPHDDPIWEEVADELARARELHPPMNSGHEAVAVIREEVTYEFEPAVYFGVDFRGRPADPRKEAIQIAAMAIRYIIDVADR